MVWNCAVKGCTASGSQRFRFPSVHSQKDRFLRWLAAAGNPDILCFSPDKLRKMRVCGLHFELKYMLQKCLTTTAVPTLHLPDAVDVSIYEMLLNENNNSPEMKFDQEYLAVDADRIQGCTVTSIPEANPVLQEERVGRSSTPVSTVRNDKKKKSEQASPLRLFNLSRKKLLSPKEKELYNTITRLRKSARKAQKRNAALRSRVNQLEKMVREGAKRENILRLYSS